MVRKQIVVVTDGSCIGNGKIDAFGGWAAILMFGEHRTEISGGVEHTTNNRMELMAVLEAAKRLKAPCEMTVITDSKYVCRCFSSIKEWAEAGWYCSKGNRPKNLDLLKELMQIGVDGKHKFKFQYVKGHSGHPDNERADALAKAEALKLKEAAK